MVHETMYLRMYGLHLHTKTMMMRMLWVTMGMYVPFVAPTLSLRRCPCMTSVSCNIVWIALARIAAWGVPTASERGAESEVAHKWARWLHNPCRLGCPHRFRGGGRIRGGPQVGKVAT